MRNEERNTTRWYERSGRQTTEQAVRRAIAQYAAGKRTGKLGNLPCSLQPAVADRVERMTPKEFASWLGTFTWRE